MGLIAMKALAGGLVTNADAAFAYIAQYDNVLPIWGIQRLEELEEGRLLLLRTPGTSRLHGVYFWREIASASKCF